MDNIIKEGAIHRRDAGMLIQRLAESLVLTAHPERITVEIAGNGNVFIDGMLAATIREK